MIGPLIDRNKDFLKQAMLLCLLLPLMLFSEPYPDKATILNQAHYKLPNSAISGLMLLEDEMPSVPKGILPKYDLRKTYHFEIDEDKRVLKGRGQWQLTGYAASDLRSGIAEIISEGESSETYFARQFSSMNMDSIEMINPGISTLPVMVNFNLEASQTVEKLDTEMVLQPFLMKDFNHNPFLGQSRISDEEFQFPYRVKEKIYITIPPGYEIWGLPKNEQLNVRKQEALVKLEVQEFKEKILLTFDFSIENPVFKKKDQDILKAIFDKFMTITQSAIILKKKGPASTEDKE